ncbi:MAG: hypothetical protein HYS25_03655 [Ignavibacteriales bacterium]|nr:hypothetical protein [Ignavibacteriales bacterium]
MKKQYDFSKGVRGKFYRENLKINLPIYLDSEQLEFIQKLAAKKRKDVKTVVNDLIKTNMKLAQVIQ